jgi:hypothetical protein
MRKLLTFSVAAGVAVWASACSEAPTAADQQISAAQHETGNGFFSGGHDYRLNLIGVPQDKTADMDGNNGRRIFVRLHSDNEVTNPGRKNNHLAKGGGDDQNHIYLCNSSNDEGDSSDPRCTDYGNPGDFRVLDANATDGDGALLAVPDPCVGNDSTDGCTPTYQILARAHGPGGSAEMTTCATEDQAYDGTQDTWCGDNGIELYPKKGGKNKAQDISDALLYMTIYLDGVNDELENCINGTVGVDYPAGGEYDIYLFDRCFEDYFWNYDNDGLKLLEMRFYAVPTI